MTSLKFIALSFNDFTGSLRNNIGLAFPNLQKKYLPNNFFTGTIPESFSNASNLRSVELIGNNFTGKVLLSFTKLDLERLSVGNNHLGSGEPDDLNFVTSITNCSNLDYLDFAVTSFKAYFPTHYQFVHQTDTASFRHK